MPFVPFWALGTVVGWFQCADDVDWGSSPVAVAATHTPLRCVRLTVCVLLYAEHVTAVSNEHGVRLPSMNCDAGMHAHVCLLGPVDHTLAQPCTALYISRPGLLVSIDSVLQLAKQQPPYCSKDHRYPMLPPTTHRTV